MENEGGQLCGIWKIKKGKIVVTMNMKDYEILNNASVRLKKYEEIFKRAKIDGTAVLTDELKEIIENPSSED